MAAPAFIAVETATGGNVDSIAISSAGALAAVEEGDLLVAMVSYGDIVGSPGRPAGWFRITDAVIAEDVELQGELLFRYAPAVMPDEFVFTSPSTGAMAVVLAAYRGVDAIFPVDAQDETAETVGGLTHDAPSIVTVDPDEPVRLLSAFFFWLDPGATTQPAGQTKRADIAVAATGGGTDRDVGLLLSDESFASPGATGVRQAVSTGSGLANALNVALMAVSGDLTAFDAELGGEQGRILADGVTAPDGSYVLCLGSDLAQQFADMEVGDFIEFKQSGDFDTANVVKVTVRSRAPAVMPAGLGWKFSLRIGGAERVSQILNLDDDDIRDREFGANVSQLAGNQELAFRLELVNV